MSQNGTALGFVLGTVFGAAVGTVAGILLAPRSGAESRAMAADAMNDAWDAAVDTYENAGRAVSSRRSDHRPHEEGTTDELRSHGVAARERMDQVRSSLSNTVAAASAQVQDAVASVAEQMGVAADAASAGSVEAQDAVVEPVADASQAAE